MLIEFKIRSVIPYIQDSKIHNAILKEADKILALIYYLCISICIGIDKTLKFYFYFQPHLMDINFLYPLKFPFNPSDICFEKIEIPEVLQLGILEKI